VADQGKVPEPTELIYLPPPSWAPALAAVALAGAVAGLFAGWFYALVGGLVFVAAVWLTAREAAERAERLPRRQRLSTAVIPALPVRSAGGESRTGS
jgi:hypothetical protein